MFERLWEPIRNGRIPAPRSYSAGWRRLLLVAGVAIGTVGGLSVRYAAAQDEVPPLPGREEGAAVEGVETLTHGPIHEAFAAPTVTNPEPGPVIQKEPPENVQEEPPTVTVEGSVWISGYWEWD